PNAEPSTEPEPDASRDASASEDLPTADSGPSPTGAPSTSADTLLAPSEMGLETEDDDDALASQGMGVEGFANEPLHPFAPGSRREEAEATVFTEVPAPWAEGPVSAQRDSETRSAAFEVYEGRPWPADLGECLAMFAPGFTSS